ncbi:MAG: Rne/Rng family ribonuclease [Gaiellaceae bacterium MAG52_C11]|nr:Rne/Rng family ribonuclease [Candidatus Gaiellasilicea maunaloa]
MSPWFRRKRKKDEQQVAEATPAPEAPPEAVAPDSPESFGVGDEIGTDGAPKRRRGNRGGRGRRKPGTATLGEQTAPERTEQVGQARHERKPQAQRSQTGERSQAGERSQRQERRANQQGNRRRVPQKRAPLPKAKRELLISVDVGEQRVAILEDDRVAEVYLERPDKRSIAGNIYLGTVDNVLPGMEAAFVEIGLEKNGFLYVDEIVVPELEGKRHGKKITDLIARGQEILVQAVKDPMKTKGARLTTEISLPGRFLVFVPQGEGLGVSRRLDDAERARLKEIIKSLDAKEGGIIVRTAAEGASAEDIERDLVFLQRLWKTIQANAKAAKAPALVYQEAELPLRIVRDLFAGDFESAQIDHERTFKRIVGYLKKTSPHMLDRVHRYKEKTPLFEGTGVDAEIRSTLSRRVDLPSGGYLVFDYAEAFTVIDVNTGRFVGSRSKSSGARLEDTITKNNLEAVKEVVRQLRLRDIGGIIVIDFIDMANPKNRAHVEEALRNELERDRTKTYVVEISPLGLVEMTRQNVTDGPREILTKKCPTCDGDGIVVSEATAAMEVERRLRVLAAGSRAQAFRVEVSARTAALLIGSGADRLTEIEAASKKRFFLVPKEGAHADHLAVLEEGKLTDLQPASPVAEGSEVELKLVELGLHDAHAAAGKLDGLDVIVGGAAKLVGKKAKVRIERVLDGSAYATLLSGGATAAQDAITFESEAEKPTRAPGRARKATEDAAETEAEELGDEVEVETGTAELDVDAEADEETEGQKTAEDEKAPAKKKTRRGSRGGRNRKRKSVTDADADADGLADVALETDETPVDPSAENEPDALAATGPKPRTPRIHVPRFDLDEDEAKPKPRSRAKPPLALVGDEPGDEAVEVEAVEAEADTGAGLDDDGREQPAKKKTRRGSRGGRNRRKPVVVGENGDAPQERRDEVAPPAAAAVAAPDRPASEPATDDPATDVPATDVYVPMSEWGDEI